MATTNIGSLLPLLLLSLLLPSSIYATITVETARLIAGDNARVFKDGRAGEATIRASYIPVHVSLVPLDGDLVELTGRNLRFLHRHRHRHLVDMGRPRRLLRRFAEATEDVSETMPEKRLFTVRRMGPGCGGMSGGGMMGRSGEMREAMMGGGSAKRFRILMKPSRN